MTTNEYIRGVRQSGWPAFPGKLWQRNYWEHVVRDEMDWNDIRGYIQNNPAQWEMDKLFVGQNDGP
jgi:REP element-mobilizing transposase RayT